MRKVLILILIIFFIFFIFGCSKKTVSIKGRGGKVEVTREAKDAHVKIVAEKGVAEIETEIEEEGEKGEISIKTEEGETVSTTEVKQEDLGIQIYPGAKAVEEGSWKMEKNTEEGKKVKMVTAIFYTSDSVDKVSSYYKKLLGDEIKVVEYPSAGDYCPKGKTVKLMKEKDGRQVIIKGN